MARKKTDLNEYGEPADPAGGCMVESIISIDERGQMVLPRGLRERANIRPGDRFALTTWEKNNRLCCITLTRVEDLSSMVRDSLGSVIKGIV